MATKTGTVKWFNVDKGYGFIVPNEGGKDVFVHISAVGGLHLKENQKVSFDLAPDRQGRMTATNVVIEK